MNDAERKRVEQLCRWIPNNVTSLRGGKYLCDKCPIPKHRGNLDCPAGQMKHACSTELIKYFTEVQE